MTFRTSAGKFRLLLALLAFSPLLAAQTPKQAAPQQLKPAGYVNDFAEILNVAAIQQMTAVCEEVDHKAKAQIAVVTVESLGDADIESYAADLFKRWGVGGKSSNRGVMVLLAVQERKYRIEVGYGLEPILPDGKVGGFGREAAPLLQRGDYGGAAQLMTWRIAETISADAKVTLEQVAPPDLDLKPEPAPSTDTLPPSSDSIPTGVIITVVVVFLIILGIAFAIGGWGGVFNVFLFILNIILSSGSSSSSSGGFGGGGGFGGFGGGSSGGGGASGSW